MYDISVIIPAYNAEEDIATLLDKLSNQKTRYTYEVVAVDNASSDRTPEILDDARKQSSVHMVIVSQPRGVTIATVRNFGVKNSSGRVLAFIDSDCEPPLDWLDRGCSRLDEYGSPALLAGGCCPPPENTWVQRAWHAMRAGHKDGSVFVHGANFFISRKLFDEVNGFREELQTSEDYDLGRRVSEKFKILSDYRFTVIHHGDSPTLIKKLKKEIWYGKNSFDMLNDDLLYKPFWVSVLFVSLLFVLLLSILTFNTSVMALLSLCLIMMPVFLSLYLSRRAKDYGHLLPLLPISFVYLLGRGVGIFDGFLTRISHRKRDDR